MSMFLDSVMNILYLERYRNVNYRAFWGAGDKQGLSSIFLNRPDHDFNLGYDLQPRHHHKETRCLQFALRAQ